MPGALRDFVQLDFDACAGARGGFAGRAGQAGCAHVLNAGTAPVGEKFQAGFANEFFHERIAHLDGPALALAEDSVKSCEAKAAPASPSRPVAGPT